MPTAASGGAPPVVFPVGSRNCAQQLPHEASRAVGSDEVVAGDLVIPARHAVPQLNCDTNGTFLDRTKVSAPTPVPLGVPIRIGKTTLELRK